MFHARKIFSQYSPVPTFILLSLEVEILSGLKITVEDQECFARSHGYYLCYFNVKDENPTVASAFFCSNKILVLFRL